MNFDSKEIAQEIFSEIQVLPVKNTPALRTIRRRYSRNLSQTSPKLIFDIAREIIKKQGDRWIAFELIRNHGEAFKKIGEKELREFGQEINSWGSVDAFAGILAGPAWQQDQVPDKLIHEWAHSEDRWWRRAALVSTVALNRKTIGGSGDIPRTLEICRLLVEDKDDMVVKAMSWALRELIPYDPDIVREFLNKHENVLAARIKREVNNKLTTGLKNPKRKKALIEKAI